MQFVIFAVDWSSISYFWEAFSIWVCQEVRNVEEIIVSWKANFEHFPLGSFIIEISPKIRFSIFHRQKYVFLCISLWPILKLMVLEGKYSQWPTFYAIMLSWQILTVVKFAMHYIKNSLMNNDLKMALRSVLFLGWGELWDERRGDRKWGINRDKIDGNKSSRVSENLVFDGDDTWMKINWFWYNLSISQWTEVRFFANGRHFQSEYTRRCGMLSR